MRVVKRQEGGGRRDLEVYNVFGSVPDVHCRQFHRTYVMYTADTFTVPDVHCRHFHRTWCTLPTLSPYLMYTSDTFTVPDVHCRYFHRT